MTEHTDFIRERILQDMSEGVMTIGLDGIIAYVNPAALRILDRRSEELLGQRFARCFFEYPENDGFNQAILDAVYDTTVSGNEQAKQRQSVPAFRVPAVGAGTDPRESCDALCDDTSTSDHTVTYFITNRIYDIYEINAALFEYGQPILGE